jgi:hypothetical protein
LLTTRPEHVGLHGLDGRWSRKYDCCVECGRTTRPHAANGHCDPCYVRLRGRRSASLRLTRPRVQLRGPRLGTQSPSSEPYVAWVTMAISSMRASGSSAFYAAVVFP